MSLLLLRRLNPTLRMNIDAMMTVSGITLEGPTKKVWEGGHWLKRRDDSKPDPDRWKRRKLRKLLQNLQEKKLLQWNSPMFFVTESREQPNCVLRVVPADGFVCYSDQYPYVERRPTGHFGNVYGLAIPHVTRNQSGVLQEALTCKVDPRVADICTNEIAKVKAALARLCERCKIGMTQRDFAVLTDADSTPLGVAMVCSIFAACSKPRGIVMNLKAILPVFDAANDS